MSARAFWKAICAEPDDNTPRLVYADWLDEQGDPASVARAEFIRAQVELAHLEPWTERAVELRVREQVLAREHRHEWLELLPGWVEKSVVTFRRGMPHGLSCRAPAFVARAGGFAKNTPFQELTLRSLDSASAEEMASLPHLARLRSLAPTDGSWDAWGTILASSHLTNLRELRLADFARDAVLPHGQFLGILQMSSVRSLRRFSLRVHTRFVGPVSLLKDVGSSPLTSLRELEVATDYVHPQHLADLLNSPVCAGIVSFRTGAQLDRQALAGFALAKELPSLKSVEFAISDALAQSELLAAFASPLFHHVEWLSVQGFSDAGLARIADSQFAEQLRVLRLPKCEATAPVYREVFSSGRFRNLAELEIPACPTSTWRGHTPLMAVSDTKGLEGLRHLILSGYAPRAPNVSLDALAASPHLPNLSAVTVPVWFENYSFLDSTKRAAFEKKYSNRFAVLVE